MDIDYYLILALFCVWGSRFAIWRKQVELEQTQSARASRLHDVVTFWRQHKGSKESSLHGLIIHFEMIHALQRHFSFLHSKRMQRIDKNPIGWWSDCSSSIWEFAILRLRAIGVYVEIEIIIVLQLEIKMLGRLNGNIHHLANQWARANVAEQFNGDAITVTVCVNLFKSKIATMGPSENLF